jgi:hypothetical protein
MTSRNLKNSDLSQVIGQIAVLIWQHMKKTLLFASMVITLVCFSRFAPAQQSESTKQDVPPVMYGFLAHILDLQPYLYSKESFVADENKKIVSDQLQEFASLAEQLKKHDRLQTPGFKIPAMIIVKELRDVNEAYQAGHREYAWRSLRSTLNSCTQCHTQVSQAAGRKQAPIWKFENQKLPKDPMELADFWFMIRAYDKAFEQFSRVVEGYGKEMNDQFQLRKALRHILTISLRIDQNPETALNYLNQLKNIKIFPKYLRDDIQVWKNELTNLHTLPPMDTRTVSVITLQNLIEDLFRSAYPIPREGRSKEVAMEYGSGLLFEFVNQRPKEVTQRMYYWLGISTIELNRFDFTSFGDTFLKECIEDFAPTPVSEECYEALKDNWIFGYSGSAGIFLPKSNKEELKRLEKILIK